MVVVPYVKGLSEALARILKSYGIATTNRPQRTLYRTLWFTRRTRSRMKRDRIDLYCPLQELLQLICWKDKQEVRSEDQGTQEKSGLFHSWYTDPSLHGKGEQCNSEVGHHRPCRGREPCHRQGKKGRQRGIATDQMDKRSTLDQEDTDVHESGCKILPTQPHMGSGDFQVTCSIHRAVNN